MKLQEKPISKADILEYLRTDSDFSFEISVLQKLNSQGFSCEHAGTYEDPITRRTREFDIRARKTILDASHLKVNILFSVECKNLRSNFPLVVHSMPRRKHESWIELIRANSQRNQTTAIELSDTECPYQVEDWVGKACDQVGRRQGGDNCLVGNDGDVYDKISQAVNSSYELLWEARNYRAKITQIVSLVIPILVVPDGRLWRVRYSHTGDAESEPTLVKRMDYYLNKTWSFKCYTDWYEKYRISHMQIVEASELEAVVKRYTDMPQLREHSIRNRLVKQETII